MRSSFCLSYHSGFFLGGFERYLPPGAILRQAQDFMFYLYILLCDKAFFYVGITNDLDRRYEKHENGYVKATKHRRPLRLIHFETFLDRKDAKRREQYLKGGNGKKDLEIMLKNYFEKHPWAKV